jgi:hypothetical protein
VTRLSPAPASFFSVFLPKKKILTIRWSIPAIFDACFDLFWSVLASSLEWTSSAPAYFSKNKKKTPWLHYYIGIFLSDKGL